MFENHELNGADVLDLCTLSPDDLLRVLDDVAMSAAIAQLVASGDVTDSGIPARPQVFEEEIIANDDTEPLSHDDTNDTTPRPSTSITDNAPAAPSLDSAVRAHAITDAQTIPPASALATRGISVGESAVRGREGFESVGVSAVHSATATGGLQRRTQRRLPVPPMSKRQREPPSSLFDYYVLSEPFDENVKKKTQLRDLDRVPYQYDMRTEASNADTVTAKFKPDTVPLGIHPLQVNFRDVQLPDDAVPFVLSTRTEEPSDVGLSLRAWASQMKLPLGGDGERHRVDTADPWDTWQSVSKGNSAIVPIKPDTGVSRGWPHHMTRMPTQTSLLQFRSTLCTHSRVNSFDFR